MKRIAMWIAAVCLARDAAACCGRSNASWTLLGWSRDGSKAAFWTEGDDECRFWKSAVILDATTGEVIEGRHASLSGDIVEDEGVRETRAGTRAVRRWAAKVAPLPARRFRPRGLDVRIGVVWESIESVIDVRARRVIAGDASFFDYDEDTVGDYSDLSRPRMYVSPDGRHVVLIARSELHLDPLILPAAAFARAEASTAR